MYELFNNLVIKNGKCYGQKVNENSLLVIEDSELISFQFNVSAFIDMSNGIDAVITKHKKDFQPFILSDEQKV